MRYRAMAKHFLFEAALQAARDADLRSGDSLEVGRHFSEVELLRFRSALQEELRSQQRLLENAGVLATGNLPVTV